MIELFHYCSNKSFLNILEKRSIFCSDFSLSNDSLEGMWIKNIVSAYCHSKNVDAWHIQAILSELDLLHKFAAGAGFCMSEKNDSLSQWRAYADNGQGVCIGFSKEYFDKLAQLRMNRREKFTIEIRKIIYNNLDQQRLVAEIVDQLVDFAKKGAFSKPGLLNFFDDDLTAKTKILYDEASPKFLGLLPYFFSMKNDAFEEEQEWRISSMILKDTASDFFTNLSEMSYRAYLDRIVPYYEIPLEDVGVEPITKIFLGPKNITPIVVTEAATKHFKFANVKVENSKASYR